MLRKLGIFFSLRYINLYCHWILLYSVAVLQVLEFRGGGWFTNPYLAKSDYQAKSNQLWIFEYIPHQVKSLRLLRFY